MALVHLIPGQQQTSKQQWKYKFKLFGFNIISNYCSFYWSVCIDESGVSRFFCCFSVWLEPSASRCSRWWSKLLPSSVRVCMWSTLHKLRSFLLMNHVCSFSCCAEKCVFPSSSWCIFTPTLLVFFHSCVTAARSLAALSDISDGLCDVSHPISLQFLSWNRFELRQHQFILFGRQFSSFLMEKRLKQSLPVWRRA